MLRATVHRSALVFGVIGASLAAHAQPQALSVTRRWYDNGQVAEVRTYVNGRESGVHRGFWPDGQPRFEYSYANGLLEGTSREWLAAGGVWREQHYASGHEQGLQRLYWPDGRVRASYEVVKGRRYGLMGAKGCVSKGDSTETSP